MTAWGQKILATNVEFSNEYDFFKTILNEEKIDLIVNAISSEMYEKKKKDTEKFSVTLARKDRFGNEEKLRENLSHARFSIR